MLIPTTKSGTGLIQNKVITPAEITEIFASASFLAERYAAKTRLCWSCRNFASKKAQVKLTISAPSATSEIIAPLGAEGLLILYTVVIKTDIAGINKSSANTRLKCLRATKLHPKPIKIKILTDASSKKSILSANSETEPIFNAKINSTIK